MKRFALQRVAALAMAVSFLLGGVAEQLDEHACAHHDAIPSSEAHGGGGGHAHHGGGTDAGDTDSEGESQCTCLGACAVGSAPGLPTAAPGTLDDTHAHAGPGAEGPSDLLLARSVAFLLPYANAPPFLG